MENKRGDSIAMIILVILALVSSLSLLSLFLFYQQQKNTLSPQLNQMFLEIEFANNYVIEESYQMGMQSIFTFGIKREDLRKEFQNIARSRDRGIYSFGDYFAQIRNGNFELKPRSDGSYILEIPSVFIRAEQGTNSIYRNLNISLVLNSSLTRKDITQMG